MHGAGAMLGQAFNALQSIVHGAGAVGRAGHGAWGKAGGWPTCTARVLCGWRDVGPCAVLVVVGAVGVDAAAFPFRLAAAGLVRLFGGGG
jgi:hypothetical protein